MPALPDSTPWVNHMKRIGYVLLALLGLGVPLVSGQLALAAGPAPITGELPQRSGTIDILNLEQGLIVIDDAEFRITDQVTVHGRNSGTKHSLTKGMQIRFSYTPGKDRSVIDEIWIGQ
jgi:hypothetical protein